MIVLCAAIVPMPADILTSFLLGAVLLILGMGLFSLGADMAMMPIGEVLDVIFSLVHKLSFSV